MKQRKLLLVIICTLLTATVLGAIIYQIINQPEPNTSDENNSTTSSSKSNSKIPSSKNVDTSDGPYDEFDYKESTKIENKTVDNNTIVSNYVPLAEKAAVEYVKQYTGETSEQRAARLQPLFTIGNEIPWSRPPMVTNNKSSARSDATILYSRWSSNQKQLLVTVFLLVKTVDINSGSPIDEIYQAYLVTLDPVNNSFLASDINFSDDPVVITN